MHCMNSLHRTPAKTLSMDSRLRGNDGVADEVVCLYDLGKKARLLTRQYSYKNIV